jgi:hypothetical protein
MLYTLPVTAIFLKRQELNLNSAMVEAVLALAFTNCLRIGFLKAKGAISMVVNITAKSSP